MGVANISGNILTDSGTNLSSLVSGSGTTNYLPKFTGASTIGDSIIYANSTSVGIGTASPTSRCLTLYGTSDTNRGISFRGPAGSGGNIMLEGYDSDDNEYSNFEFVANSGGGYFVFNSGTGTNPNSWTTNAKMVIGTNGRVGIGTSSPSYTLDVLSTQSNTFRLLQNINGDNYININNTSTGTAATSRMDIGVNSNSYALTIQKFGLNFSGTLFGVSCTNSSAIYDNSASSNGLFIGAVTSTPIIFGTSNTERMRITSGGVVLIGTTSVNAISGAGSLQVAKEVISSGSSAFLGFQNRASTNFFGWYGNTNAILYNDAVGNIVSINASSGAYTATSDIRLKENINESENALDKLMQVKVKSYDWISNKNHESFGLIAQELYEILPEYTYKPEIEEENWGIAKAELVPMLIKAIQEQQEIINQLSAKVTALENK